MIKSAPATCPASSRPRMASGVSVCWLGRAGSWRKRSARAARPEPGCPTRASLTTATASWRIGRRSTSLTLFQIFANALLLATICLPDMLGDDLFPLFARVEPKKARDLIVRDCPTTKNHIFGLLVLSISGCLPPGPQRLNGASAPLGPVQGLVGGHQQRRGGDGVLRIQRQPHRKRHAPVVG